MWYCPSCGERNGDKALFCTECGSPKPRRAKASRRRKKRSYWWLWLLICLAVLGFSAVVCYYNVHLWAPAGCTEPETCRICGKTMGHPLGHQVREASCTEPAVCTRCGEETGPALGHDPIPATCLKPSVCSRCGETLEEPLGHDWQPATYEQAEICLRCGELRGEPRGWLGEITGTVGEETLQLYSNCESHPYLLDAPVRNACRLTLHLKLSAAEGSPYGKWGLYGRDFSGNWELLGSFVVSEPDFDTFQDFPMEFEPPRSFDALSFIPLTERDYSISYSFYYSDVQQREG